MKSYLFAGILVGTLLAGGFAVGGGAVQAVTSSDSINPCLQLQQYQEEEGEGLVNICPSPSPVVQTGTSPTPSPVVEQVVSPSPSPVSTEGTGGSGTGSISGTVYLDNNGNGVKDGDDPGLQGVTVTLNGNSTAMRQGDALVAAAVSQSATTNSAGAYSFSGLSAGTYTVSEVQPACNDGSSNVGSLGGSAGTNTVTTIPVTPGASGTGYNFGERPPCNVTSFADTGQAGTLPIAAGLILTGSGLCVLRLRRGSIG